MLAALSVERIKLMSTKSPYWCLGVIVAAVWGFALISGRVADSFTTATTSSSQAGSPLGLMTFMVMAALSITTEYRFGTIRNSFLAVPQRGLVLVSKTVLLAVVGAVVGGGASLIGFYITKVSTSDSSLMQLSSATDLRVVLGYAALYALGAVLAIGVGAIVRQSAGAITILLLWALLVETLLMVTEGLHKIVPYLPFNAAFNFVSPTGYGGMFGRTSFLSGGPSAGQGLVIFMCTAVAVWLLGLLAIYRRDA